MSPFFKKLNLKDQAEILVLNTPDSFESELLALQSANITRSIEKMRSINFALAFATRQVEVDEISRRIVAKSIADVVLWFAYPKATSKKYRCDFNRDSGWTTIRDLGFDTVRQVAIDEDWSALRFRRTEYIGVK